MSTPSLFNAPPLSNPQPASPPPVTQTPAVTAPTSPPLVQVTQEDIKQALPQHLRASVTQSMADTLNTITNDPIVAEEIRNNFVSYANVLKEGRFKTEDYINAVAYVSFKLMGHNNEEAYALALPQRYATLVAKGTTKKDISAYVSAFHRGKLVNMIMEQCLVPTWVLNQDLFQKALNAQADLMLNATSELVRTQAANSILTHLKKPEPKGDFQINLNTAESSGMKEMKDMLSQLAQQQQKLIQQGDMKTIDVAGSKLINKADAEDVD